MTKKALLKEDSDGGVIRAIKGDNPRKRKILATIYPQGGGHPYEVEVEPGEDGLFTVGEDLTFKVVKGSVIRGTDGRLRTVCHEGNPHTVSAQMLEGDDVVHPKVMHTVAYNNYITQFGALSRAGLWRQFGTWGLVVVLGIMCFLLVWMVKTIGGGMEELRGTLEGIQVASQSGAPGSGAAAGHNNIAPGGR